MSFSHNPKIYVIIPAAGSGSRMGKNSNKLFMEVAGIPVIERTLKTFMDYGNTHCIVVTNEENINAMKELQETKYPCIKKVVLGGNSRTESVNNGVQALSSLECPPDANDYVLIHDGARCMLKANVINNCCEGLKNNDVCVAGVPTKNTIKIVKNGIVESTPDRSTLYEVQTPQCFKYDVLKKSYDNATANGIEATDDTALAEILGYKVAIVEGSYSNIKITTPEDIDFAQGMLERA